MNAQRFLSVGCALAAFFSFPLSAPAGDGTVHWDISGGRATITNANGYDRSPAVAPDGNGGLIIAWEDEVSLTPGSRRIDLRIQHLDENGNPTWSPTGGGLLRFLDDSVLPALLADGSGGAYIAWWESTSGLVGGPYTLLVHHLSSAGGTYWSTPTAISSPVSGGPVHPPQLVPDPIGGALVAFNDRLAQIKPDGTVGAPGVNGIPVGTTSADRIYIATDRSGGVYAAWQEFATNNVWIQKINAGFPWGAPKLITNQFAGTPTIASDGTFGALVAWSGTESSPLQVQIRAQRVNSAGTMLWAPGGVVVADSVAQGGDTTNWLIFTSTPVLTHDNDNGAILAWLDPRNALPGVNDPDPFAQRIDSGGTIQWLSGGILLPPYIEGQAAPGTQSLLQIVPDGRGGAVTTCGDRGRYSTDISATRLSHEGVKLFSVWVYTDSFTPSNPGKDQLAPVMVHDVSGPSPAGPIIAYIEDDPSTEWDIYANKVELSDAAPANDACGDAETILVDGPNMRGNTGHAALDAAPFCDTSIDAPGVWFRVTGDGTTLTATTCNDTTEYDTKLNVYCGPCSDLVCVAGNDDQSGGADPACTISSTPPIVNRASTVSWCSAAGVNYYILVQGYGGETGPFNLTVASGASCGNPIDCGACTADFDGNGSVGFSDLTQLLNHWGPCGPICPEDLDEGGTVGFSDLTTLLASWGACP